MDSMKELIDAFADGPQGRRSNILTFVPPRRTSDAPVGPAEVVCHICKGAGYTRQNVPYGHPQFGKAQLCACKKMRKRAEQQRLLLERSGIVGLKRFEDARFESFQPHLPGQRRLPVGPGIRFCANWLVCAPWSIRLREDAFSDCHRKKACRGW